MLLSYSYVLYALLKRFAPFLPHYASIVLTREYKHTAEKERHTLREQMMMKKKGGVGFKAVSLNDSFEEEEDLEEEASPFPHPPGTKRNDDVNEKEEEEETFATPMTTFKIKTLGSDDATAANDDGLTSEERGGVSAKTNVASGGNGNGGFCSNDSSPTTLIANESRDTISELRNNNNINASQSPTKKNNTNFLYNNNHQQQYNHHQNRNEKDNNESDVYHVHNRSISATSMDGLISRLDEESGNGGVGERTNDSRFNEFSDGGGRRREDGSSSSSNAIVRACSKALDIPWCFGESRKTRKNVVSISIVLLLILFAAIPLRHWQHMS